MIDYSDVNTVNNLLKTGQEYDQDNVENVRESQLFLEKKDGQWEPEIYDKFRGRPRYTFDRCNPIVDQIVGDLDEMAFTLRVGEAGGDSSKDIANTYDGLIRNIRNISDFDLTMDQVKTNLVGGGVDHIEVVQKYADTQSFDQDLIIEHISCSWERVAWDPGSLKPDRSDAMWVIVSQSMTPEEFKTAFPEKSEEAITGNRFAEAYSHKPDLIEIGRIQYKKPIKRTLLKFPEGQVYFRDEVKDLLDNIPEGVDIREREVETFEVHQRLFTPHQWLNDEEKTAFTDYLPVIPFYGNFKVIESKIVYRSAILKLMDQQRSLNYIGSREVEEAALSPRAKFMFTPEQVAGYTDSLATMNTNSDPAQLYNHVEGQPQPYIAGGYQPNGGLINLRQTLDQDIGKSAGLFAANMGDNPGLQSGEALKAQVAQGNKGSLKWFKSMSTGLTQLGRVLIQAIPKVYDSTRQIRIIGEDGTSEVISLNQTVIDPESGQPVELNNLSQGKYDVVVEIGEPFKNQQRESAEAFTQLAQVDPSILQVGKDAYLRNINVPGMEVVADRVRGQMVMQGLIPEEELTDEERAKVAQAQAQPQEPSPEMVLAQAEMKKAENESVEHQLTAQKLNIESQKIQLKLAELQDNSQARRDKLDSETALNVAKVQQENRKIDLSELEMQLKAQSEQTKLLMEQNQSMVQGMNTMADTLNKLKDAMGADAIISPTVANAYEETAEQINQEIENQ